VTQDDAAGRPTARPRPVPAGTAGVIGVVAYNSAQNALPL
jgi:hypothetical protein